MAKDQKNMRDKQTTRLVVRIGLNLVGVPKDYFLVYYYVQET